MEKNRRLVEISNLLRARASARPVRLHLRVQAHFIYERSDGSIAIAVTTTVTQMFVRQRRLRAGHKTTCLFFNLEIIDRPRTVLLTWCLWQPLPIRVSHFLLACVTLFFPLWIIFVIHNQKLGKPPIPESSAEPSCWAARLFSGEDEGGGIDNELVVQVMRIIQTPPHRATVANGGCYRWGRVCLHGWEENSVNSRQSSTDKTNMTHKCEREITLTVHYYHFVFTYERVCLNSN